MRVNVITKFIFLTPDTEAEAEALREMLAYAKDHVFELQTHLNMTAVLKNIGPRAEVCRDPVLVQIGDPREQVQLIGNFAHTPFELHGEHYASVEGFWQGLKFPDDGDRRRVASLHGAEAQRASDDAPSLAVIFYRGAAIRVGWQEHSALMAEACHAKFAQNETAMCALLSTGSRPLIHSYADPTIHWAVVGAIWMGLREQLLIAKGRARRNERIEQARSVPADEQL